MRLVHLPIIVLTSIAAAGATWAQGESDSGFLSDYSKLQASGDEAADLIYIAPGTFEKLAGYDAIMVDQPEIFISADSKYKGMKPDDMTALAEAMRDGFTSALGEKYYIVESPGPNVLYLRLAATDLYLKKKKRGLLSYTPGGAVLHAAKSAATQDIMKKISLVEMTVEAELLDSQTMEQLVAVVESRGQRKDKAAKQNEDPAEWESLQEVLNSYGLRLRCRLDNARLPKDQWVDCTAGP